MSRFIKDSDGDHVQLLAERDGKPNGVSLTVRMSDPTAIATVGPLDPHELIEAIKAECELHEDDEVHGEELKVPPVDTFTITGKMIDTGRLTVRFEDSEPLRAMTPDEEPALEEDPEKVRGTYVHTTPATAEEPRLWAGADEPIIDSLIGRVADLEDERERTADHWNQRLHVVSQALLMIPDPGKVGGLAGALNGQGVPQTDRVPLALKIARFVADEYRDIPGVD